MNLRGVNRRMESLLDLADIKIGGTRPWDLQVHDERLYLRVLLHGSLGLGEAYMDGWWDCEKLDEFFFRVLTAELDTRVRSWPFFLEALKSRLLNQQNRERAHQIGQFHYDIGNDFYRTMLDKRMIYTAGYWKDASSLDEAQEAKLELISRRLHIQPGMRILDIGCGWGGTAKYLAERYSVHVVGITVSAEQVRFGREICRGLPVEIRLQDYRSVDGSFDRIVSLGMFEHVGYKNYRTFMQTMRKSLKDDGLFLLRTIGTNHSVTSTDPWIGRYIFPSGMLPSPGQLGSAIEGVFVLEEWSNYGPDYDKTLMHWFNNFHTNWGLHKGGYGDRFYRMWKYYLLSSAGAFRSGKNRLWEIILSPNGDSTGNQDDSGSR